MSVRPAAARLFGTLGPRAAAFEIVLVAAALAVAALDLARAQALGWTAWRDLAVFAAAAALAQLLSVRTGGGQAFHTAIAFVTAGAILLPPELLLLMVVVQHVPESVKERYRWFVPPFNIANFALSAWAARLAAEQVGLHGHTLPSGPRALAVVAVVAAVFGLLNHLLLVGMLWLRRRGRGGLLAPESLVPDLGLAALGVALAALWTQNPWLLPAIAAPLALVYRVFRVHGLLRDSEERFRTLFDAAPIGMVVRELETGAVSTNRTLREMLARDLDPRLLLSPEDARRQQELDDEVATGLRSGYTLEQHYRLGPGGDVFGQVDVALVRDAAERPRFLLSMIQDVTGRKRLEEQLVQAQKMEAIGRLAGGVAHDFNNLLTAISGYADFARHRAGDRDPELRDDIAEIEKAAGRAHQLTRQLLAFGRKQIMEPQVLSLNDVVGDADTMLRRLIGENIEVVTAYGGGLGRVLADPGQVNQVIVNLVVNARDEMPDGGTLTIETANRTVSEEEAERRGGDARPGSFVTLSVRDTGNGMDGATKARLFEPFFTRKEVGKGTGLGLATVYGIVDQSGGFVDVQSEPGLGATFTVYLPSLGTDVEPTPPPQPEPRHGQARPGSESILVVEDERAVRRYVETVLTGAGYRVATASHGAEAVELARTERFDLLLTDMIMPRMSGSELARRVGLPVVFMSGYSGDLLEQHGPGGGVRLLQKPFSAVELQRQVRGALDEAAGIAHGAGC